MTAYQFVTGSIHLTEQVNGEWVLHFQAYLYSDQVFHETSNTVNAIGVRVIEFDIIGDEIAPTNPEDGESAPFIRSTETQVEIVLTKDGKRKNVIYTGYP